MILKRDYNKIMDKIEVTDEMKIRILERVNETPFNSKDDKIINFFKYKHLLPLAACFLFLLMGIKSFPNISNDNLNSEVQITPEIVEYDSTDELSKAIGFKIYDIVNIPFEVETSSYTAWNNEIASIFYSNDQQSAVFRKSKGNEDNSGDYTDYNIINEVITDRFLITLKGNDGLYSLAIWTDGEYSYSLQFSFEITQEEWINIISRIE